MSDTTNNGGNHAKLLANLLKGYRTLVVVLLTAAVFGLFSTRELVVRLDERLGSVEKSLATIEARQYESRSRTSTQGYGEL